MDFGKVLGRAWEITWRWKVLWILGFLASLGSGGSVGGGNYYTPSGDEFNVGPFAGWQPDAGFWAGMAAVILGLICLFLIIAIIIWVVSIIARGGLIAGVQQVEETGETSFRAAWVEGRGRFWSLLGVSFLASLPMLIVGLALVVAGVWAFFAVGAAVAGGANGLDALANIAAPAIISAACLGGLACCGLIILGIVLAQIRIYAERAVILESLGWIDAFKRGWQVIKENLGPTIILWLIFLAIGFMIAVVIIAVMFAIMVPVFVVLFNVDPGPWMVLPACCGGLFALLLFALIGAIVQTFTSATWTLAYRELTGMASPEAGDEPTEEPPDEDVDELAAEPAGELPDPEPVAVD